jgi:hypothetical protein
MSRICRAVSLTRACRVPLCFASLDAALYAGPGHLQPVHQRPLGRCRGCARVWLRGRHGYAGNFLSLELEWPWFCPRASEPHLVSSKFSLLRLEHSDSRCHQTLSREDPQSVTLFAPTDEALCGGTDERAHTLHAAAASCERPCADGWDVIAARGVRDYCQAISTAAAQGPATQPCLSEPLAGEALCTCCGLRACVRVCVSVCVCVCVRVAFHRMIALSIRRALTPFSARTSPSLLNRRLF